MFASIFWEYKALQSHIQHLGCQCSLHSSTRNNGMFAQYVQYLKYEFYEINKLKCFMESEFNSMVLVPNGQNIKPTLAH